ncbi:MAG: PAS domain S-box protein [Synechococcaceae cyanobacterium RL_1_2]|nr:PAS domain S-box protein [Synechococcaceae cyanobacterium RL_1_2]
MNNDITEIKKAEIIINQEKQKLQAELEEQAWEQKLTKESLQRERNIISNIFATTSSIFILTDHHGRIVRLNQGATKITGYEFNELFGKYFWEVFAHPEDQDQFKAVFDGIRDSLEDWHGEHPWMLKNQTTKFIAWSNSVVESGGEIAYFICNGVDVSMHQAIEDELKASIAQKKK